MRELVLTAMTRRMLDRIRRVDFPLSVCGRSHARVMLLTRAVVNRRLSLAGLSAPAVNQYRRAVTEMVKAFRTRTAGPLAQALRLAVRKWANFGLDPELLQALACDIFDKFEAAGRLPPKPKGVKPPPRQRRRPRRTYEQALGRGRATHGTWQTAEAQAACFARAVGRNRDISNRLAPCSGPAASPARSSSGTTPLPRNWDGWRGITRPAPWPAPRPP